ncbi:MAG: hypothetical protein KGQ49_03830, partial [Verrucomicrobia bacterium]|nr:hypothetical protein [Verrucomicrobiota bacterium]
MWRSLWMDFFAILSCAQICTAEMPFPRRVISFWDGKADKSADDCLVHKTLEMPLNHLGIDVMYSDIQEPLPPLSREDGVLGVILCFRDETKRCRPIELIDWAIEAIELGKKVLIFRNGGFLVDQNGFFTPIDEQNRLFERLGLVNSGRWVDYPFDYKVVYSDSALIPFERNYSDPLPGFYQAQNLGAAESLLKVAIPEQKDSESDLILVGPHGAYVASLYENNYEDAAANTDPRSLGWHLNPFLFFEKVFEIGAPHPIPDVTTLAGRRIFYSSCDGDNWKGATTLEDNPEQNVYCAEIVLQQIIRPYPHLPMSMGIIAAVLDPAWVGDPKSQQIAREYLALPQVEAASHSYSHPFDWTFFKTGGPEKEIKYLPLYPYGSWQNSYLSWFNARHKNKDFGGESLSWGYVIPRAYANQPFHLDLEISGAASYIDQFAPPDNQVHLLLWPGDGKPWAEPVALCQKAGLKNLGGGFVRFDPEYPSNLFVYPIGRKPGGWIQPYSSMSAENSYSEGWSSRFYGFQYLPATLQNTES